MNEIIIGLLLWLIIFKIFFSYTNKKNEKLKNIEQQLKNIEQQLNDTKYDSLAKIDNQENNAKIDNELKSDNSDLKNPTNELQSKNVKDLKKIVDKLEEEIRLRNKNRGSIPEKVPSIIGAYALQVGVGLKLPKNILMDIGLKYDTIVAEDIYDLDSHVFLGKMITVWTPESDKSYQ